MAVKSFLRSLTVKTEALWVEQCVCVGSRLSSPLSVSSLLTVYDAYCVPGALSVYISLTLTIIL